MGTSLHIVASNLNPNSDEAFLVECFNGTRPDSEVRAAIIGLGYDYASDMAQGKDAITILKEWWTGLLPSITAEVEMEMAFDSLLLKTELIHWG